MSTNAELLEKTLELYKLQARHTLLSTEAKTLMEEVAILQMICIMVDDSAKDTQTVLTRLIEIQKRMTQIKDESEKIDQQFLPLRDWLKKEVKATGSDFKESLFGAFKICNN